MLCPLINNPLVDKNSLNYSILSTISNEFGNNWDCKHVDTWRKYWTEMKDLESNYQTAEASSPWWGCYYWGPQLLDWLLVSSHVRKMDFWIWRSEAALGLSHELWRGMSWEDHLEVSVNSHSYPSLTWRKPGTEVAHPQQATYRPGGRSICEEKWVRLNTRCQSHSPWWVHVHKDQQSGQQWKYTMSVKWWSQPQCQHALPTWSQFTERIGRHRGGNQ